MRKTNRSNKDELNLLGFLTHMLNNCNYINHQPEDNVSQMDMLFFVYYSMKAAHKFKAIYYYLPQIKNMLDEYILYTKGGEILD